MALLLRSFKKWPKLGRLRPEHEEILDLSFQILNLLRPVRQELFLITHVGPGHERLREAINNLVTISMTLMWARPSVIGSKKIVVRRRRVYWTVTTIRQQVDLDALRGHLSPYSMAKLEKAIEIDDELQQLYQASISRKRSE